MNARDFLTDLIRFPSVSASSNVDVSLFTADTLSDLGFEIEKVPYTDSNGVAKLNIVAKRNGNSTATHGGFAYFGHTDVVPATTWSGPGDAFDPVIDDGKIFGRGSCDMKGSIVAMVSACEQIASHAKPIYITLTADEETGMRGAEMVARESRFYREMVERNVAGIIGEPTLGHVVHGHKGYAVWTATAHGIAGHSSTYDGESATLKIIPFLTAVHTLAAEMEADPKYCDERFRPPTPTLNAIIQDDAPALNVTSPKIAVRIFARVTPPMDVDAIDDQLRKAAESSGVELSPLRTRPALYRSVDEPFVQEVAKEVGDPNPNTVSYGTDGSCFGELANLVVLGPGSIAQAHTSNEFITLDELDRGVKRFRLLAEHFTRT